MVKAYTEETLSDYCMEWTRPQYTRSQVEKAGKNLIKNSVSSEKKEEAVKILNNWRSSHAYPLNIIQSWLRREVKKVDNDPIINQRLKRSISIQRKLRKLKTTLVQIQDIGGCRAVFNNISNLYKVEESLNNYNRQHVKVRERNYIQNPKYDGYRGIHLVYQFGGEDKDFAKHQIEIQLRTKIQHSWATGVEIIGTFIKENLKNGEGDPKWLKFFELTGLLFSELEGCLPDNQNKIKLEESRKQAKELEEELKVFDKLKGFSVATEGLKEDIKKRRKRYFLIILDANNRKVGFQEYQESELEKATNKYKEMEEAYKNEENIDVVLVGSDSLKDLQRGYPNYFVDSELFLENLAEVLN